jgi:prepilin-type N-terminal cleavage/methylation domain-containing protein
MNGNRQAGIRQGGFSLLEMMVVLLILGIVSAGLFVQINNAEQRAYSEQVKLDNFQEARDFVDQFFRDINEIGYPNSRMVDTTSLSWSPALTTQAAYTWGNAYINDNRLAMGLVKIDANEIQFEGDINGNGTVQSMMYMINGSGNCGLCLQRSQVAKVSGNPLTGQTQNWGTETNDVISNPIFSYFQANGTQITALPVDISTSSGAQTIASIKTIKISLVIRNNAVVDPKTGQPIETVLEGEVSLNNCSMAASGQPMSC